jgi:hypothetical protein
VRNLINCPIIILLFVFSKFIPHTESVWIAFLDFLRAHPQLKRLSLYNADLSEEQVIELMGILCDYNTELTHLDVGGKFCQLKLCSNLSSMNELTKVDL